MYTSVFNTCGDGLLRRVDRRRQPLIAGSLHPLFSKEPPGADCEDQIRSVCSKNQSGEDFHRDATLARSAVCTSPGCVTMFVNIF